MTAGVSDSNDNDEARKSEGDDDDDDHHHHDNNYYYLDYDRCAPSELECVPSELEFGGRLYPADHVRAAKNEQSRPGGHRKPQE